MRISQVRLGHHNGHPPERSTMTLSTCSEGGSCWPCGGSDLAVLLTSKSLWAVGRSASRFLLAVLLTSRGLNQSIFYFMSVHIEMILDKNKNKKPTKQNKNQHIIIIHTNFPTGLWTIDLTILVITSILYKISLTLIHMQYSVSNI